jgi:hypothetical protein
MTTIGIVGVVLSAALIFALAMRDPKRIRSANRVLVSAIGARPMSSAMRRVFGVIALAPGVVLGAVGLWAGFFIWLGALCVLGWVAAQVLAPRNLEPLPARAQRR